MAEELLGPTKVAQMLGVSRSQLWRLSRGTTGITYIQLSPRKRRYRPEDVEAFIKSRERGK